MATIAIYDFCCGATVKELAEELQVTTRTIWRDLAALQGVGFRWLTNRTDGRRDTN